MNLSVRSILILAFGATATCSFSGAIFQGIGYLWESDPGSYANAVTSDGNTVVGQSVGAFGYEAMKWQQSTGPVGLGDFNPDNTLSGAMDISTDGRQIVGFGFNESNYRGFYWTSTQGMQTLGTLQGGYRSIANGVSADGMVVVGTASVPGGQLAFRWSPGLAMMSLGDLYGHAESEALDVSANGGVIVGTSGGPAPYTNLAFRWTPTTGMVSLGDFAGGPLSSVAYGVSDDGTTIVGRGVSFRGQEAFVWKQSTGMVPIGDLPGGPFSSLALATNWNGSMVVGESSTNNGPCAFIWTESEGMRELGGYLAEQGVTSLQNWTLTTATDVSADGKIIVGLGISPNGQYEGFVVKLGVPNARSIGGGLVFQGLEPGGDIPRDAMFRLTNPGESNVVATIHGFISPKGEFVLDSPMPPGRYDLLLKVGAYLQKRVEFDTQTGNVVGLSVPLIPGDIEEDNEINLVDLALLVDSFGTEPSMMRWNKLADLNGDGEVNCVDLGILATNFGVSGDE